MKIRSELIKAAPDDLGRAVAAQFENLAEADFVACHFDVDLGAEKVMACFAEHGHARHISSSCLGAMTRDGHSCDDPYGLGIFAIFDPEGDYGTAACAFDGDPKNAGRQATIDALEMIARRGEAPDLIWMSVCPGVEEDVLSGIIDVVGPQVPILGGSAADNDVSGNWSISDGRTLIRDGVVVTAMFPSARISFAYQNGHAPTEHSGMVTRAQGRTLYEIDHKPAAEVYSAWSGITLEDNEPEKFVLAESTFGPLGRHRTATEPVPHFLLAHPSMLYADGRLELFANVAEGEHIVQMEGTREALIKRAGRVVDQARKIGAISDDAIIGGLNVYCGGCMLGVRDAMDDVVEHINASLAVAPFLGVFTFGEQGPILNKGNSHGNLMISAVVFYED